MAVLLAASSTSACTNIFSQENLSIESGTAPVFMQEVQYTEFPAFVVEVIGSPKLNADGKGYFPIEPGKELYNNSIIVLAKGESLTIIQENGKSLVIKGGIFVLREKLPHKT
jgi:hypothetical protein